MLRVISYDKDLKCLNGGILSNKTICLCPFGYSGSDCGNGKLSYIKQKSTLKFYHFPV